MTLGVTFNGTTLFEGLSGEAGDWAGTDGISTEVFQQGVSSEGWIVAKNGNETAIYDYYAANGNVAANMSGANEHLYIHMRCDVAPFIDYLWIGISSTSAGTTNYEDWQIVDNTVAIEWYGEWKTFIVDINATAGRSNGTLTLSDVRSIRVNVDNSNSGNIRSIENTYLDVGRFGTGITASETTSTAFDFTDIEAIANNSTNKFGVLEESGGVLFARGEIVIGDSAGTDFANLTSADETLVFIDPSVSGENISTGLYKLDFVGNATNPTAVTFGTKVGTGDTATGRNGTTIQGESASISCSSSTDANVSMDLYGSTFRLLGGLITWDDLDIADDMAGTTFDGCDQVVTGKAVCRTMSWLNSTAISTSGALLWDEADVDVKNSLFVNNVVAIEMQSLTGDPTFTDMSFSGNTNDVRYEGATDWDLNWSGGTLPTVIDAGAGTLTPTASVDYTINNVENLTEITILDRDVSLLDSTGTPTVIALGDAVARTAYGQNISTAASAGNAERIRLRLRKVGTPTDGVYVGYISDDVPGVGLEAVSQTLDAADITTSFVTYDFDIQEKIDTTALTPSFEIQRTGAVDGSNYYEIEYSTVSVIAGERWVDNNGVWGSTTGDLLFSLMAAASDNSLYHAESVTTGTTTWTHGGTAREIEVLAMSLNYRALVYVDDVDSNVKSQSIAQQLDGVYLNP